MLRLARGQTERGQNALQVVVAVIFDLDSSAFLTVVQCHPGSEMFLQSILQIINRGGRDRRRACLPSPPGPRGAELARDEALGGADGRAAAQDCLRHQQLFLRFFQSEQDLRVSHGKQTLRQPRLHLLMQIEQPHRICDRRAAPANFLRDVFLAHPKFIREPGIRLRFLDGIEIRALQIFDQRNFEDFQVGGDASNHRHLSEPRFLRRPPAAFPGDQFVPAADIPNNQRLDDSMLANRFDQFVQGVTRKIFSRLQRTRHDAGQTYLVHFLARFRLEPDCRGPGANQRAETFAKS